MNAFVRGTALLGFTEFATRQGLDPLSLLAEVSIPTIDPDQHLSAHQFNELLELCAQRSKNPLFGLQFGLQYGTRGIDCLLHIVQNADTAGDVLRTLGQYFHVYSNGAELRIERHARNARLLIQVTDADTPSVRQTVELAIGTATQLMQRLLKRHWRPHSLLLRHPAGDAEPGAYRSALGVTPRFNSLENAWIFEDSLLNIRLDVRDERVVQLMQPQRDELDHISLQDLPGYVQKLLRNRMPYGRVTLEQISEDLGISPRSLQRYLLAEGTSFQTLLDLTRQAMAIRFILDSSISLTQLAGLLGYAQPGAFSRAFTRWFGLNPQKWKLHRQTAIALAQTIEH